VNSTKNQTVQYIPHPVSQILNVRPALIVGGEVAHSNKTSKIASTVLHKSMNCGARLLGEVYCAGMCILTAFFFIFCQQRDGYWPHTWFWSFKRADAAVSQPPSALVQIRKALRVLKV